MLRLTSDRLFASKSRPRNLWLSGVACLACLGLLSVLIADLFAAEHGDSQASEDDGSPRPGAGR